MSDEILSKQEKINEIKRCSQDPSYFINRYVKISHPQRGQISFDTYEYQDDLLNEFKQNQFNIVLKARQMGVTTLTSAYILWILLFNREKSVLTVATKLDKAKVLVEKCKKQLQSLPDWLIITDVEKDNQKELKFENGSSVKATTTSSDDVGRAEALSLLVLDEAAHIDKMETLWESVYPTLSEGGDCIAVSCVTEDTIVFTEEGIKEVGSFANKNKNGSYKVDEYNIRGRNKTRQSNLFHNNGKVETKIINTKFAELEGSKNHKLWACKNGQFGWYKLDQLEKGDFVSIEYGMDLWGNNDDISDFNPDITPNHSNQFTPKNVITEEIAYFLGLYYAEGNSYIVERGNKNRQGGIVTITCGEGKEVKSAIEKMDVNFYKRDDGLHYDISSQSLVEFLEYMGIDVSQTAKDKEISDRILEMSKDKIAAFLRGYFDGDGYADASRARVGVTSASEKLIDQVRAILINFGILSHKRENYVEPTEKVSTDSRVYILTITGRQAKKFHEKIGFEFKRKDKKRKIFNETNFNQPATEDLFPFGVSKAKELFEYFDGGNWSLRKYHGLNLSNQLFNKEHHTEHITRENLLKLYKIVKDKLSQKENKKLKQSLSEDVVWVPIKSVEESKSKTYDFSLPNNKDDFWDHSVLYNGIIGHQTPKGTQNWFHKKYIGAEQGENKFNPIEIEYDEHPDRDEEWLEEQRKNFSEQQIAQEYLGEFLASGRTVIDPEDITRLEESYSENYSKLGMDRNYWQWEEYNPNYSYFVTADVARGDGNDFSAFHVFEAIGFRQVAEYKGQLPTDRYAPLLKSVGEEYGNAMLVVENNSIGLNVLDKLEDRGYENIYYSEKGTHEYVEPYKARRSSKKSIIPGVATSGKTRPVMIDRMEEYIRNEDVVINSQRLVNELKTFIWENGKAEAQKGYNDDLVMALAIACWVRGTIVNETTDARNKQKAALSAIKKDDKKMDMQLKDRSSAMKNPLFRQAMNDGSERDKERRKKEQIRKRKEYIWLL